MNHRFTVIFEKEHEGGYHVFCPAFPGCHTQSESIEEGIANIHEAMQLYVESLAEDGLPSPEVCSPLPIAAGLASREVIEKLRRLGTQPG